jgi:hypothetical protein
VQNWWLWCKPGDLIVVDEAQFVAPRGTLGRKPPYWVQSLEVHRHYGVDFIFITQHPGLIDAVIKALVGLHRHVRSVMGSPLCMVYVWDHASNPERFTLANKTMFRRRKSHYALFHSSVAHVKPPTAGRGALMLVPLLLLAGAFLSWRLVDKWSKPPAQAVAAVEVSKTTVGQGVGGVHPVSTRPKGFIDVPDLQGCYAVGDDCRCMDRSGRYVRIEVAMCKASASSFDGLIQWQPSKSQPPRPVAAAASHPSASVAGLL